MNERLRKWVKPDLGPARLARQWSAIEARATTRAAPRWRLVPAGVVALVAIAAVVVMRREHTQPNVRIVQAPKSIAVGVGAAHVGSNDTTFDLRDGSHVVAALGADVTFSEDERETRCEIHAGSVDFDVKHDPSRAFVVVAGSVRVVDIGTHFRVEYGADHDVHVTVREGSCASNVTLRRRRKFTAAKHGRRARSLRPSRTRARKRLPPSDIVAGGTVAEPGRRRRVSALHRASHTEAALRAR